MEKVEVTKLPQRAVEAWVAWEPTVDPVPPFTVRQNTIVRMAFMDGFLAATRANDEEIARLKSALEEIVNPVAAMQQRAEAEGNRLSGMAWEIARDPAYLQGIAKEALENHHA